MARPFGFDISTDLSIRMKTWAEQFISESSYKRYERACAFVADETAKRLALRMNAVVGEVFDRPTPWMKRAWQYRRGLRAGARPGEAVGTLAKRRVAGCRGVYKGEFEVRGSRLMGYITRPSRDKAPFGKNGRIITVNLGRPRALLIAIHQASYKPVMQEPLRLRGRRRLGAGLPHHAS